MGHEPLAGVQVTGGALEPLAKVHAAVVAVLPIGDQADSVATGLADGGQKPAIDPRISLLEELLERDAVGRTPERRFEFGAIVQGFGQQVHLRRTLGRGGLRDRSRQRTVAELED